MEGLGMRERIVTMTLKFLASAFAFILLLAQIPAAALPTMGANALKPEAPRTEDPREVVADGFEDIIGRELDNRETRHLNQALAQLQTLDDHPQVHKVAMFDQVYDLWQSYEKLPVICLYGKFNGKIPFATSKFSLNGLAIGYEITPCLVLNSFHPLAWRTKEFRSYVMQGIFSQAGGQFGGVAGGLMIGVYAGPRNLASPLIGTYGFIRATLDRKIVKVPVQVAYSNNKQILAMIGIGAELSFDAVLQAMRLMPKVDATGVTTPVGKIELGMYFDVKEFPWFQRLAHQGMNPIDAFADMNSYIASAR
jgi:hypothetical protein